jgi:serine/threonine protein kinase
MISRAATIEPVSPAAGSGSGQPVVTGGPRGGALKFQYASGSRPLDGYVVKRGIGRGGFGEVYFAQSDAGKEVALKHVERNLEVELRGVSQCLNLKHVNLIDLYDVRYDEQGDAWVVMEYVAGASLKDVIDRNPNGLPLDQVLHWFRGLAAGTAYLHDHGIVHRDLKPGNVFDDANVVKIGDYGLSKFISCSRRSGQTESVGTFHYMAPEIGKGVYGKEIDIYALGIILYEMITGRVPFEGESSQEIIMKHLTADPDLSSVPQPYRSVIQRAMQKDPEKRFSSVGQMLSALENPSSLAGTKLGPGPVPTSFASANPAPALPVYIGDEDDGIELGPLHENALTAEIVKTGSKVPAGTAATRGLRKTPDEPIARAFTHGWRRLSHWWNHGPLTTPLKIGLLIVAAVFAIASGGWLIPIAVVFACVYMVYLGIRLLVQAIGATTAPVAPTVGGNAESLRSSDWSPSAFESRCRQALCMKTAGDCIGELTGSMLAAAAIALVLTIVMSAISGEAFDGSATALAGPAWLWLCTTIGSWLVLSMGKFYERSSGEPVKRRFALLVAGLVFGSVAFAAAQFLLVTFHGEFVARELVSHSIANRMYGVSGDPKLAAFLAYFGAIFVTVGWWKQTDPLRVSRLRIGPILTTLLAAWIWWMLFGFPQPWGFMLAAAIAITVQLAAPWLSQQDRAELIARRKREIA